MILLYLRSYVEDDIAATGSIGREVNPDKKFCNNDWNKQEEQEWAVKNVTCKERVFS